VGSTAAKTTTNLVAGKTGRQDGFAELTPFLVDRNAILAERERAGTRRSTSSSIQEGLNGEAVTTRGLKHRRDFGLRHFSHGITRQRIQHEQS
jgi:hypothetical protein